MFKDIKTFAIGVIDRTNIVIDPPKEQKNDYIDRSGSTSICLQAICDETGKFMDICVGYPGSVDDSIVFQNSFICPELERLCEGIRQTCFYLTIEQFFLSYLCRLLYNW